MFGTCGIRKKFSNYDRSEQTFSPSMALRLGLALGTYLRNNNQYKIVIGRDVRKPSLSVEYALISGLLSTGCKVFTIGLVSTPTICMSIDYLKCSCGVMITASHNPAEYIGIKIFGPNGLGYNHAQEMEIEDIYQKRAFIERSWKEQGYITEVQRINATHIRKVLSKTHYHNHIRKLNVIMDPGNGSASEIGPMLLGEMGLNYITLNSQPDGNFPGRPSEPSEKNLKDLRTIVSHDDSLELGIAFDGDADRVVFIDESGNLIESIRVLTFLARKYIKENYPDPNTRKNLSIVTPVNSSGVIEYIMEPMGVTVYRTKIGDINVSNLMEEKGSFLGGENCGVYIWPEFSGHNGPDTLMAIAILLRYLGGYDVKFTELLKDIPIFPYIKGECHLEEDRQFSEEDYHEIARILIQDLNKAEYKNFKETYVDGLHVRFDEGWILIRKSGTTPIMRVTAESKKDMVETEKLMNIGKSVIQKIVKVIEE
ncbi:MAG: phosphoglucosamine mutase [Promethearchaeota archaeon]